MVRTHTTSDRIVLAVAAALALACMLAVTARAEGDPSLRFITKAVTHATVDSAYRYQATAVGTVDGQLKYRLDKGPEGMTCDSTNGLVTWDRPVEGSVNVQIRATLRFDFVGKLEAIQSYILTCVKGRDSVHARCAVLQGTVALRSTAEAITDGLIHAWRVDDNAPIFYSNIYTSVIANGAFSFTLPQGTYVLRASAKGEAAFETTWHAADSLSSLDVSTADRIDLSCDDTVDISFLVNSSAAANAYVITGTVVDAETMAGLNATVTFTRLGSRLSLIGQGATDSSTGRFSVETAADGSFSIELPNGYYTAMASASAQLNGGIIYVPQFYHDQDDALCARVFSAASIVGALSFELRRAPVRDTVGSIRGRLFSSLNTVVTGSVSAYRKGSAVIGAISASASVMTDAEGRFEMTDIPVGDYILCIRPDNDVVIGGYFVLNGAATSEWRNATIINVASMMEASVDVFLNHVSRVDGFARITGNVAGTASSSTDVDISGAVVTCLNEVGDVVAQTFTTASGAFTLEFLAAGQFSVTCDRAGYHPSTQVVDVTESEPAAEQSFRLSQVTSVEQADLLRTTLAVSPNPATSALSISFDAVPGLIEIRLVDGTGRIVDMRTEQTVISGPTVINLPLDVQQGWYMVTIRNGLRLGSAQVHVVK